MVTKNFVPYLRTNLFSTSCTGVSASVAAVVVSVVRLYVVFDLSFHPLPLLIALMNTGTETSCHCASNSCDSVHDSFSDRDLCRGYSHCGRTAEFVWISCQGESQ